jgi:hypothetical protein
VSTTHCDVAAAEGFANTAPLCTATSVQPPSTIDVAMRSPLALNTATRLLTLSATLHPPSSPVWRHTSPGGTIYCVTVAVNGSQLTETVSYRYYSPCPVHAHGAQRASARPARRQVDGHIPVAWSHDAQHAVSRHVVIIRFDNTPRPEPSVATDALCSTTSKSCWRWRCASTTRCCCRTAGATWTRRCRDACANPPRRSGRSPTPRVRCSSSRSARSWSWRPRTRAAPRWCTSRVSRA